MKKDLQLPKTSQRKKEDMDKLYFTFKEKDKEELHCLFRKFYVKLF